MVIVKLALASVLAFVGTREWRAPEACALDKTIFPNVAPETLLNGRKAGAALMLATAAAIALASVLF